MPQTNFQFLEDRAVFSPCERYRYTLWRRWGKGGYLQVIGLNPSTADSENDDPTIRRCIGFAKRWGYGALCMTNLFAYRATKPADMKAQNDPVGSENDHWLVECSKGAAKVLAAWGTHGAHLERAAAVKAILPRRLWCLRLNDDGSPQHPLYIPTYTHPDYLDDE